MEGVIELSKRWKARSPRQRWTTFTELAKIDHLIFKFEIYKVFGAFRQEGRRFSEPHHLPSRPLVLKGKRPFRGLKAWDGYRSTRSNSRLSGQWRAYWRRQCRRWMPPRPWKKQAS